MTPRTLSLCISALAAAAPCALAGPDWVEGGTDAGSTLPTAQHTIGVGQILTISGSLGGSRVNDLEDMFLIQVTNPVTFHLTTPGAGFDAQLFLFNITQANEAFGLLANDNTVAGNVPVLTPMATDGTFASINNPGAYAIAIAGAGRYPVSVSGAIFFFASPTEVSGPDGPGGINPHIGWAGEGATGHYDISVTGVGFYETPAPGAGALLALAGGFAARRSRRWGPASFSRSIS